MIESICGPLPDLYGAMLLGIIFGLPCVGWWLAAVCPLRDTNKKERKHNDH